MRKHFFVLRSEEYVKALNQSIFSFWSDQNDIKKDDIIVLVANEEDEFPLAERKVIKTLIFQGILQCTVE